MICKGAILGLDVDCEALGACRGADFLVNLICKLFSCQRRQLRLSCLRQLTGDWVLCIYSQLIGRPIYDREVRSLGLTSLNSN